MEQKSHDDIWVWVPFEVDKKFDGWRIDQFLTERLSGYSRSKVQKILADARVHRAGKPAKINARVKNGDKIEVAYLRTPEKALAPEAALEVLFEDEHLLIINKPSNLLSHPTDKVVHNTVLGVLRHSRPDIKSVHLLHRLDRETSGVMALGKTPAAARAWTHAMDQHLIQKEYAAIVCGVPKPAAGVLDRPIGRQGGDIRVRQWVDVEGAVKAVTRYETVNQFTVDDCRVTNDVDPQLPIRQSSFVNRQSAFSLVRAFPQTGRLHQIRVHLSAMGTPLLGDPLYTGDGGLYRQMVNDGLSDAEREKILGFPRVALHAARLTFAHPSTEKIMTVEAPMAADMQAFIRMLRLYGISDKLSTR